MSLQFIIGNSGSGKSTYLYERVIEESRKHPKRSYLVIVPEQFTMETQKELVHLHPDHAIMNIDVLSFDRLAFRVFDELGTGTGDVLEETGKNLVLRKVAENKKDELTVLKGKMTKKGYISEMKSLISELTQYNVNPEGLEEMIECKTMSPAFRYKAQDILVMYQGFLDYIQGKYITTEEILQLLIDVVEDSPLVKDSVMVFDGFTGFTPIQNQLLRQLLRLTRQMLVTVTMDVNEDYLMLPTEAELFAMSKKMTCSLVKMARETGTQVLDPIRMDMQEKIRFSPKGELFHLEQNLFRMRYHAYSGENEESQIQIYSLPGPRSELEFVAGRIVAEIRKKGYHYRDFAVVCANLDSYRHYVPSIFTEYGLPYFIDTKSDIVFHPFIEMISAAFEMVTDYFSYESVSRFLRSGLHNLSMEERDILDNYLVVSGICGQNKFLHPFTVLPKGYDSEKLVEINQIREKFMEAVAPFLQKVHGKEHSVEEFSKALYEFLLSYHIQERIQEKESILREQGEYVKAREYEEIYGLVMNLLDKMVTLLGEEMMDAGEYIQILETGLETAKIGIIPPSHDSIVIGDIERTRLEHMKVIFLIGANDGAIPKSLGRGGILSQMERELLKEADYELAPTDREKAFMQKFYLYLMMTKPSEKLVITYGRVAGDGSSVRRSYLIGTLEKLFPKLQVTEIENLTGMDRIVTEATARNYLVESLRDYAAQDKASPVDEAILSSMLAWYETHPIEEMKQIREAVFYSHKKEMVGNAVMRAITGDTLQGSVTRLEQYSSCAYAYFLNYGLRLSERREHALEVVDMGTLYHETLDMYSKLLQESEFSWFDVTEEASKQILSQAILSTYQTMTKSELMENARDAFVLKKMEHTMSRCIWALTRQVRKGKFTPAGFEVSFGAADNLDALRFQLDETEQLQLRGKIDRMDTYEDEDKIYVKIIDYKSGNQKLSLLNMFYGLQIQLILYLGAATEKLTRQYPNKEVEPAGMFYYHIDNPLVEDKPGAEEIEELLLKELRMRGLVNAEEKVIQAMDENISGSSSVIPVTRNKDGSLGKKSNVATTEQFALMEAYVAQHITNVGRKIQQGEVDCKPYQLDKEDGCMYCPYHGVCGFDSTLSGYEYRKLKKIKDDNEILGEMRAKVEGKEGDLDE